MSPSEHPDCYNHLLRLRAVRQFQSTAVSEDDITAILEAGRWTGSARNLQDWAFVVMSDPEDVARLAEAGRSGGPLTRAALAIALVRLPNGNDFDMGRAAHNMMLAAAALGVGSCPVRLPDQEVANEVLGLPDADHVAARAIAFGYPDTEAETASRVERRARGMAGRKPLDAVAHRGRFAG